jgi:hypothetical protein
MAVDEGKLNAFLGQAVGDLGAAMSAILVLIGDELGLYAALARERLTSGQLAERTGTSERIRRLRRRHRHLPPQRRAGVVPGQP